MRKVLITGASGQIGQGLIGQINKFLDPNRTSLNLLLRNTPITLPAYFPFRTNFPTEITGTYDLILHLAAIIKTPYCEKPENRKEVINANVQLTKKLCRITPNIIFLSSDNVFRGNEKCEYAEDDPPYPCNFYGLSKLLAENVVLDAGGTVVRIQTMLGCRNLITSAAIDTIRGKAHPPFWNDVFLRPSYLQDLITVIDKLVNSNCNKIFHCSTVGDILSRADIVKATLNFFKEHDLPHSIDKIGEESCSIPSFPRYLVLNNEYTSRELNVSFTNSRNALEQHLKTILLNQ